MPAFQHEEVTMKEMQDAMASGAGNATVESSGKIKSPAPGSRIGTPETAPT
jgi:hypothetical protein